MFGHTLHVRDSGSVSLAFDVTLNRVPAVMATFDQLESIHILDKDPTTCRVPITDIEVSCKCDAGLIPKTDCQTNNSRTDD
jgi:hypothetical protein